MPIDRCIEKPKKPLTPVKKLDIIFRRRYVPNTQFDFTTRKSGIPKADEKYSTASSFAVPKSQKLLSYLKYCDKKSRMVNQQRQVQPLHMKDNVRMAGTRDIAKRLYIPEPPDDVKCVVEIHPEFYTVIEGRPIRALDDVKVYISNIRGYAMNRQQIGFRRDRIIKIQEDIVDEYEVYNKTAEDLKTYIQSFQNFLTEDYKKSCAKVAKADKIHEELENCITNYLSLSNQVTAMNNVLFTLDYVRKGLKLYRSFLFHAASLSWREEHDETYSTLSFEMSKQAFAVRSSEFVSMSNDLVQSYDIDAIIQAALIEFKHPLPADLFFTTPEHMFYLFQTMQEQSREYLIYLSKTRDPYAALLNKINWLKQTTKQETDWSQFYVDCLKKEIELELNNEEHLQEKLKRILAEDFYDTVASPGSLKLKICIEFVYERILGKSDQGHANVRDPMKILEVLYEEYNLKIDGLDFKVVNQARKDIFSQDLEMMKAAYKAQRELRLFEEMTTAMNKAFWPPFKFKRPALTRLTPMAMKGAGKIQASLALEVDHEKGKTRKLTPEQRENLELFTNWCQGVNPQPYLLDMKKYIEPVLKKE